jgi:antitoxin CptB
MTGSEDLGSIERLRWQCRRGMLELDVLLEAFLDQHYLALAPELRSKFVRLLELPDPFIHAWCVIGEKPDDPQFAELLEAIRATRVARTNGDPENSPI